MELRVITPLKDLGRRQRETGRDGWFELELAAIVTFLHWSGAAINISVLRGLGSNLSTFPSELERK